MAVGRFARRLVLLLLILLVAGLGIWGTLALLLAGPHAEPGTLRTAMAAGFALVSLAVMVGLCRARWRRAPLLVYLLPLAGLLFWWQGIEPSNERDWQPDVAVLPFATFEGDKVRVHNIRNFTYRTETDYTPAYYDRTFDLNQLEGIDLLSVYWMGPAIAHVFLSFVFADGQNLAVSIETRKEQGEGYSTLKGFFRQYELFYVVADERDVIGLRTNYRKDPPEDVYLYSIEGSIDNARRLFLEYMNQINRLHEKPEFYNTLTTNCTTQIWTSTRVNPHGVPMSWKILASGYVPQYLYEQGMIRAEGQSFAEVQGRAYINPRTRAAEPGEDFSALIRAAKAVEPATR
jgi:hypothetical protein